jgi:hypothetical protein
LSRSEDENTRREFWAKMTKETGEEIEKHALLRVLSSDPDDFKDKWLLFFSSPTKLYYKRFPSESVMARLLHTGPSEEKDYPVEGKLWEEIRCVPKGRQGFLTRLTGAPGQVELLWGEGVRFILETDKAGKSLFEGRLENL